MQAALLRVHAVLRKDGDPERSSALICLTALTSCCIACSLLS